MTGAVDVNCKALNPAAEVEIVGGKTFVVVHRRYSVCPTQDDGAETRRSAKAKCRGHPHRRCC